MNRQRGRRSKKPAYEVQWGPGRSGDFSIVNWWMTKGRRFSARLKYFPFRWTGNTRSGRKCGSVKSDGLPQERLPRRPTRMDLDLYCKRLPKKWWLRRNGSLKRSIMQIKLIRSVQARIYPSRHAKAVTVEALAGFLFIGRVNSVLPVSSQENHDCRLPIAVGWSSGVTHLFCRVCFTGVPLRQPNDWRRDPFRAGCSRHSQVRALECRHCAFIW